VFCVLIALDYYDDDDDNDADIRFFRLSLLHFFYMIAYFVKGTGLVSRLKMKNAGSRSFVIMKHSTILPFSRGIIIQFIWIK